MSGKILVYRFMSAGCNGCDVQILECLIPKYKLRELGVEVVFTPEKANVLVVTGGINFKGKEELRNVYEKLKPPKLVVAVGNCAITKEIFDKGYPMTGPPDHIVPVNFYISGCPPRPQAIVTGVEKALGATLEEKENYYHTPEDFRGKHEFDSEKCMGCGACAQVCSSDAIDVLEKGRKRIIKVDYGHCSFCAFCQDECPTQAIKLTQEYHLLADNRGTMNITNGVDMFKCVSCGAYFIPSRQIDWAIERIGKKVDAYKEFSSDLREAIKVCPNCRREINAIRNAKRLLAHLSSKVQSIP